MTTSKKTPQQATRRRTAIKKNPYSSITPFRAMALLDKTETTEANPEWSRLLLRNAIKEHIRAALWTKRSRRPVKQRGAQ